MPINTLHELYEITKERLEGQHGSISVTFANRSHIYTGNDVIGNCLQEWLPNWFQFLNVDIRPGNGTQVFPDFTASFNGVEHAIEVKAWNINNSPAFDIANFQSFLETTYSSPGKINAYYFILGYNPTNDGFTEGFIVEKVFLKHIWEITSPTRNYPIGLQVKRGNPYAMRPFNFYKKPQNCFHNRNDFLLAVKSAFQLFPNPRLPFTADEWYEKVLQY